MATTEALKGIDIILLFRLLEDKKKNVGTKLAFQTEHEVSKKSSTDTQITKDGPVSLGGTSTTEISCTSLLARGDEMVKKLEDAVDAGKTVEIWEVDVKGESEGKYDAVYYQGTINEFTKKPAAEGTVEISMKFTINGNGQRGLATLTEEQKQVVQYKFADTVKDETVE